jgi:cytochrome c556
MKSVRLQTVTAAAALITIVLAVIATRAVQAQPIQPGPGTMPSMGHMMHDHGAAMPHNQHLPGMATPAAQSPAPAQSDDSRQLVSLPGPMQEHMLANMRDHLQTLNTVVGDVADAKFDAAAKLLEERLGMSSLPLHHATEMAPYFPEPMQNAGTSMHHAASRLAIALQDASVAQTFDAMREVDAALHEVTSACVACHTGYRIR